MIKSRKSPVHAIRRPHDPALAIGLAVVSLSACDLARAAAPADPQVMQGVQVTEEIDEGYKADTSSSPKFTAPLLDTPQTVTVIKKQLLDDQGVGSLAEALRNTPGITFTVGENGNTTSGDSITMRGFDTSGSIFLDGVRDLGAVSRDTFNIDQVEIVKGATGSDIGRAAPSGYINQSSKQPTLAEASSARLATGTDNHLRFEGDLNQPVGPWNGAAVRLNLMYDRGDRPGRDVVDNQRWGIAPSFALGLGSDTRVYFNYLFTKQTNTPDGGIPTVGLPGYSAATTTGTPPVAVPGAVVDALNGAEAVRSGNYYGSADDYEHVEGNMFTVKFEHDLSGATLRNTSRYGRYSLQRVITGVNTIAVTVANAATPETWTVSRSHQRRDEVNEVLTNQTNLSAAFATGGIDHSVSTGVEFIYERHLVLPSVASGTQAPANLYAPSMADSFSTFARSGAHAEGKTTTGGIYLFDTLTFSEQWSLNAGVRFDRYHTESINIPAPVVAATTTYIEGSDNLLTGKLGLVYKPVQYGSIYVAYSNSEQPPGGQPQGNGTTPNFGLGTGNTTNNPAVEPQQATNIEIGTKWDLLGNRLVLTAAAFDTRNKNDQVNAPDPVTGEYTQYGERKVRGYELGIAGAITPEWQINAGFASMDTEVVEGTTAQTGAQLPFSPETTFTSWTTYSFPSGLRIGGGARYVDSSFRNGNANQAEQANLAATPDYWVLDLMAAYTFNDRASVQLNVQNLTDEFYLAGVNNGGSRYTLGTPRTVLLSGTVKFY